MPLNEMWSLVHARVICPGVERHVQEGLSFSATCSIRRRPNAVDGGTHHQTWFAAAIITFPAKTI
jgi:hypothetical protein